MNYKFKNLFFVVSIAFISQVAVIGSEKKENGYCAYITTGPGNDESVKIRNELKETTRIKLASEKNELNLQKKDTRAYGLIQDNIEMLDSLINGTQTYMTNIKMSDFDTIESIIDLAYGYEKGSTKNVYVNKEEEFSYWIKRKLTNTGHRLAKVVAKTEHLKGKKKALASVNLAGINLGKIFVGGIACYSAYQLYNKQSSFFTRYMCPLTLGSIGLYYVYRGIKKTYKLWNYDAIFLRKTDLLEKIGSGLEQKRIWLECIKEQQEALKSEKYLSHKIDTTLKIKVY